MNPTSLAVGFQIPIRIGTASWSIPRQHVVSFPSEGSHLERYSQVFPGVEINSSFYRSHRASTYARWAASTPENFRFSVKAPKAITHESGLAPARARLQAFLDEVRHLGGKLGPILFQLPPRLDFEKLQIYDFFTLFRELYPQGTAVVEPRHPAWFSSEAGNFLNHFQIARAVADPPPAPEATRPSGYPNLVYCRLHGSPRVYYSSYSLEWLEKLAATLSDYATTAEVWCIFDNTASGAATENAFTLTRDLKLHSAPE